MSKSAKDDLGVLRLFNEKVARLERSGLAKRYKKAIPNVVAKFDDVKFEKVDGASLTFVGRVRAWVPDFDEDEVDSFVLTYRMFTQRNDRISLPSLAAIYQNGWIPDEARERFNDARSQLNQYLDSAATARMGVQDIPIRSLLNVVIYGGLAHTNKDKHRIYRAWMQDSGMSGFLWAEFLAALKEMMRYFGYFKKLNEAVLGYAAAQQSNGDKRNE